MLQLGSCVRLFLACASCFAVDKDKVGLENTSTLGLSVGIDFQFVCGLSLGWRFGELMLSSLETCRCRRASYRTLKKPPTAQSS